MCVKTQTNSDFFYGFAVSGWPLQLREQFWTNIKFPSISNT
jgi:hypothetical protein